MNFLGVVTETVHSNKRLLTLSPSQMFGTTIIVCSLYNLISYKMEKGKETKLGHFFSVGFKTQIQSKTTYSESRLMLSLVNVISRLM
jgi:hypothetical protein